MLVNKLIQRIVFPLHKMNHAYLFAAEKKTEKTKEAPKSAAKDAKGQKKNDAPAPSATVKKPTKDTKPQTNGKQKTEQAPTSTSFSLKTDSAEIYRKVIRGLTIKKKTERANFNQQSLVNIINVATRKDINLMYEAYYNYLGHFTPISNKTVDTLLVKTASLGQKKDSTEVNEQAFNKLLQTLQNHEYLGYFPHYSTTQKVALLAAKANKMGAFLGILKSKPLIKLNSETVKILFQLCTKWTDLIKLAKVLSFRANKEILIGVTNQQLLNYFLEGVKKCEKVGITGSSNELNQFLIKFEKTQPQVATIYALTFNLAEKVKEILNQIPAETPWLAELVSTVNKIQDEAKLSKTKQSLIAALSETAHKDLIK